MALSHITNYTPTLMHMADVELSNCLIHRDRDNFLLVSYIISPFCCRDPNPHLAWLPLLLSLAKYINSPKTV